MDKPTWATFKGHGRPERALLFRGDRRTGPWGDGAPCTLRAVQYDGIYVKPIENGQERWLGGIATKFWAAPLTEEN